MKGGVYVNLDFTAIIEDTALKDLKTPLEEAEKNNTVKEIELDFSQFNRQEEQAAVLSSFYRIEQDDRERARKVYRTYQEAIKKASTMRADILKGLQKGEEAEGILLKACNVIALITGDMPFFEQAEKDLIAVYGEGAGSNTLLEYKLNKVSQRLYNMQQAITKGLKKEEETKVHRAIAAHIAEINRIKSKLNKE